MEINNKLLSEVEKIRQMTLQLRDDLFYCKVKYTGNELLDRFNKILWEIEVPLKNRINTINDADFNRIIKY